MPSWLNRATLRLGVIRRGYNWVGVPLTDTSNVVLWAEALNASRGLPGNHALGLMEMELAHVEDEAQWGNVPAVAAATWNLDAFLAAPFPLINGSGCAH